MTAFFQIHSNSIGSLKLLTTRKINHKQNQRHHPEKTRWSLYNGITVRQIVSVLQWRKCHSQTLVVGLHSEVGFFFLPRMQEVCSWFAVCRTQPVFSPPHPTTLQEWGFYFSFSRSRCLRLTGRRSTVGRRAIICSFSHTSDRSHFLQPALSLWYSSTIFGQKWTKDQDWHSLMYVFTAYLKKQPATHTTLFLTF